MRRIQFLAIVLFALALVPGGAHLLELYSKMQLDREAYLLVQQIYRGWAMLGIIQVAAMFAGLLLVVYSRPQHLAFALSLAGLVLLGGSLAGFFMWTFPINKATGNWLAVPVDWSGLRMQWEYSHAANAVLTFLGLCCVTASSLAWRPDGSEVSGRADRRSI